MSVKRLQNRIAESRFTLPVTGTITLLTWIGAHLTGQINIISLPYLFIVISTYLMVELNNSNALMRIYSRSKKAVPCAKYTVLTAGLKVLK